MSISILTSILFHKGSPLKSSYMSCLVLYVYFVRICAVLMFNFVCEVDKSVITPIQVPDLCLLLMFAKVSHAESELFSLSGKQTK